METKPKCSRVNDAYSCPIDLYWFDGKSWLLVWDMTKDQVNNAIGEVSRRGVRSTSFNHDVKGYDQYPLGEASALDTLIAIFCNIINTGLQTKWEFEQNIYNYKNSFPLLKRFDLN